MESRQHPLRDAVGFPGILPRAKKVSTGHFFASHRSAALFESHLPHKKEHPLGVLFYGVDNGIRTHDLQSHNLTR